MFSFQPHLYSIILLSASVLPIIFLLTFYRKRITCVSRHIQKCKNSAIPENLPPVSVIIYTNNDSDNLARMLPDVLNQEYPAKFEVIVVNDGASETTKDIVNELSQIYHNLYITYTPEEARYLSRKKLSLTIGIKAARYDCVIFTKSTCRINSPQWLLLMARHFANGKEIVLGHAIYDPRADKQHGVRIRAFNSIIDTTTFLSSAILNKPYRGIDANIAYSRDIFFRNKGFSHSLNLHHGDDDIFINEIATPQNTAVEISPEAHISCVYRRPAKETYLDNKMRYDFTAKYINKAAKRLMGFSSLMLWVWLLLSIAAILIPSFNLFSAVIVAVLALILWIPLILSWRKTSIALGSKKLLFTIPFLLMYRPLLNFTYKIRGTHSRKWNYTWQQP